MTTKKQLIKLLEKKEKQQIALNELEIRIQELANELCCGDVLQLCAQCGEPMLVNQRMFGLTCKPCVAKLRAGQ
jgi:hypothetical protein